MFEEEEEYEHENIKVEVEDDLLKSESEEEEDDETEYDRRLRLLEEERDQIRKERQDIIKEKRERDKAIAKEKKDAQRVLSSSENRKAKPKLKHKTRKELMEELDNVNNNIEEDNGLSTKRRSDTRTIPDDIKPIPIPEKPKPTPIRGLYKGIPPVKAEGHIYLSKISF